jgi:hypothetical protein
MMSSPVTTPMVMRPPRFNSRATSRTASAQPCGLTPPALAVTRMFRSTHAGRISRISGTKSRA